MPTDLDGPGRAALAVQPVFSANAQLSDGAPINLISIKVFATPGDVEVASTIVTVDPDQTEWALTIDFPLSTDPATRYYLELELINETGGVRTVEWSARTTPMAVAASAPSEIIQVEVVRGPLGNLAVTGLSLTGPETVAELDSFVVTANVTVSDPAAAVALFWSSLDPEIATVGSDGTGRALKAGTARIQAEAGTVVAVHTLTVLGTPSGVVVTPESARLTAVGEQIELHADVVDGQGTPLPEEDVTWSIANASILEESSPGVYRALTAGETTVTATSVTDANLSGDAQIRVEIVAVQLTIEPSEVSLTQQGQSAQLEAIGFGGGGTPVEGLDVNWSSSNPDAATVDAAGLVIAVGSGVTEITATYDDGAAGAPAAARFGSASAAAVLTATASVNVRLPAATAEVTPSEATLTAVRAQQTFVVQAFDAASHLIPTPVAVWASSNTAVATIDGSGVATALSNGATTITATVDGVQGQAELTVDIPVAEVLVSPSSTELAPGAQVQLEAVAHDAAGSVLPTTFTWGTSDAAVASVSSTGLVTAHGAGSTTIVATAVGGTQGSAAITVVRPPNDPRSPTQVDPTAASQAPRCR